MAAPLTMEHKAAAILNAVMCFALALGCLSLSIFAFRDLLIRLAAIPLAERSLELFFHFGPLTNDFGGGSIYSQVRPSSSLSATGRFAPLFRPHATSHADKRPQGVV